MAAPEESAKDPVTADIKSVDELMTQRNLKLWLYV
jgi:hypothetical protein